MAPRLGSLAIARQADLTLVPSKQRYLVRQDGPWLHVGPDASGDVIVSIACRRMVLKQRQVADERQVRELVRKLGYRYVTPAKTHTAALASVRSEVSKRKVERRTASARGH